MEQGDVFKALADPSRRTLLDLLFQQDGQTLSELQSHLPMTRFGCMKHLQILERAGLVVTRKVGREKLHYLNPVPIQLVYDRWVGKYTQPWAQGLTDLKAVLENPTMSKKHTHVMQVYIQTTPEQLWRALTDGALTRQYYFGTRVESTWANGALFRYINADGGVLLDGEVLQSDPPRRLVTTFRPLWVGEAAKVSQVTWEVEPQGSVCKLTLTHEGLDPDEPLTQGLVDGWARILSGLKTLLETGQPMAMEVTM